VIDCEGTITHKFFEANMITRAGADRLLAAATGTEAVEVVAEAGEAPAEVEVDVSFEGADMAPGVQREIVARFRVPPGRHLYEAPVPEGLVATEIVVDETDGIVVGPETRPTASPLVLRGTGETLSVHQGDVVLRRAVAQNGGGGGEVDGERLVQISGEVRWQSCDDESCGLPQRQRFSFEVPAAPIVHSNIGPAAKYAIPMNGAEHFARLIARRKA